MGTPREIWVGLQKNLVIFSCGLFVSFSSKRNVSNFLFSKENIFSSDKFPQLLHDPAYCYDAEAVVPKFLSQSASGK